jgi:rod shape-determining protein MreC
VQAGFLAEQAVEVAQQRAAAGEHDAALGDVRAQFRRGLLQRLREKALAYSHDAQRYEAAQAEAEQLRKLVGAQEKIESRVIPAEVLYSSRDPYSHKLFIDRGATHGVVLGAPVVNETGVLGQVTRVFPLSSEVTLLIDKEAAIPVLNTRTHARSVAFGSATVPGGGMEMRYMASNADVQVGDVLTTSGVDGVFPGGLPVATVTAIDPQADTGFARIVLAPAAKADGVRHVMVLEPVGVQLPPRSDAAQAVAVAASTPASAATAAKKKAAAK